MDDDARTRAATTLVSVPQFLGSVSISLEHLPPWYQLFSLCGVFAVIHLRNNAVITWLIMQLHSSIGTEAIWVDEYKVTLRTMSFTERLCFTLYGVTLAAIVVVLFRVFCQDTYNIGWNVGQLFPDKRVQTTVSIVLMCVAEGIRLRSVILDILNLPDSLAHLALHNFEGLEATDFDPSVAESNPHFVIQFPPRCGVCPSCCSPGPIASHATRRGRRTLRCGGTWRPLRSFSSCRRCSPCTYATCGRTGAPGRR